jgi:hypothetical protein
MVMEMCLPKGKRQRPVQRRGSVLPRRIKFVAMGGASRK